MNPMNYVKTYGGTTFKTAIQNFEEDVEEMNERGYRIVTVAAFGGGMLGPILVVYEWVGTDEEDEQADETGDEQE